jgi:hypothetical protein
MPPDDWNRLGWSNVVARVPVLLTRGAVEVFSGKLNSVGLSGSAK